MHEPEKLDETSLICVPEDFSADLWNFVNTLSNHPHGNNQAPITLQFK